ncbi:MAG: thiamine-phosphate kinase, partial [Longimicrobiales bacterium]
MSGRPAVRFGPGGEFELIRRLLASGGSPARADVLVGPGDDCAVISGRSIAVTVDAAVEDIHFRRNWLEPREIGWRAATGALSDLAAVAARPIGVLSTLIMTAADAAAIAQEIAAGIAAAARDVDAVLLGGDVARSTGPLVLDIVALGEASEPILRSAAVAGDELWVTGRLGAAAAAVRAWLD